MWPLLFVMPCLRIGKPEIKREKQMSSEHQTETDGAQTQESHGVWVWVKSQVTAIMGHRFFDKWVNVVGILLTTAVGTFSIGTWYNSISTSSGANSPAITGDHNNVIIVSNAHSTQDIEKMITADIGKATITNEVCANPSKKPMPRLLNSSELDYLADRAFRAWRQMDITNAVMLARSVNSLITSKLPTDEKEFDVYIASNVWMNVQRVYPILIDDAMSNGDYDGMARMADLLIASSPTYWAYPRAMKDIALLRKAGNRLLFFSPERVRELRKMPKHDLEQYLTTLAMRGYLAPYSLNYRSRDVESVEWGSFFGLDHQLHYLDTFRVTSTNEAGEVLTSNELQGQWVGLGKYELIDVNAEATRAMGLSESQTPRKPIRLTGTITRRRPRIAAFSDNEYIKVPEPSSGMLLIIGLAALALRRQTCREWLRD